MNKNDVIETSTVEEESKIPNHWSSAAPKNYKQNAIIEGSHRAHKTSSSFKLEKQPIK